MLYYISKEVRKANEENFKAMSKQDLLEISLEKQKNGNATEKALLAQEIL